jgi:hypothetical protein
MLSMLSKFNGINHFRPIIGSITIIHEKYAFHLTSNLWSKKLSETDIV